MKRVFLFRVVLLFFMITFSGVTGGLSFAHVGADNMPDSVAEVEYSIFLEFKPKDIQVRNKLGMVYYRLKKIPKADREFSRILKRSPDNYDALDGMGLVRAAQGNYDAAVRYHRQALALDPEDMMTYYHLGLALELKGEVEEAAAAYRTSLEIFNKQYPSTDGNIKAAEFGRKIQAAINNLAIK